MTAVRLYELVKGLKKPTKPRGSVQSERTATKRWRSDEELISVVVPLTKFNERSTSACSLRSRCRRSPGLACALSHSWVSLRKNSSQSCRLASSNPRLFNRSRPMEPSCSLARMILEVPRAGSPKRASRMLRVSPLSVERPRLSFGAVRRMYALFASDVGGATSICSSSPVRSEEHTSELQSRQYLV